MTAILVDLDPKKTPEGFCDENNSFCCEGKKPYGQPEHVGPKLTPLNGTGLQILFKIEGHYFILAGPRAGRILTVNGGRIKDSSKAFIQQIREEVAEETFGKLSIIEEESSGFSLQVRDGESAQNYPLEVQTDATVLKSKPEAYAYVTFSAVCEKMTLAELKKISVQLSPTAKFWAKLGDFLFGCVRNAPKDESFADYWKTKLETLNPLLDELTVIRNELGDTLLVTPESAFSVDNIEKAWEKLREIKSHKQLNEIFSHTVGRYSERKGYHLFHATDLLDAANNGSESIFDLDGTLVAESIFNEEAVQLSLPKIGVLARSDKDQSTGMCGSMLFVRERRSCEVTSKDEEINSSQAVSSNQM